ncbi:GATA transcription factor 5-like [Pyrus ussuriensis x Pyrus communis]|uniref:GATA transcription factor 5-like n=1 Tax=Pyrus ussuriensis x Pyrus communis TaxID=2448454 RepID=A0A5N5FVJ2_9ROSA|nr:GATA transcription factor 5-like [Pyrus ussuriensis x Pyrus communis]
MTRKTLFWKACFKILVPAKARSKLIQIGDRVSSLGSSLLTESLRSSSSSKNHYRIQNQLVVSRNLVIEPLPYIPTSVSFRLHMAQTQQKIIIKIKICNFVW